MSDFLNHWGRLWAEYFSLTLVQNTLFLGLIFLALYLLRKASAHIKYVISLIGLLKLLLPPFIPAHFLSSSPYPLLPLFDKTTSFKFLPITSEGLTPPPMQLNLPGLFFILWLGFVFFCFLFSSISTLRLKKMLRSAIQLTDDAAILMGNDRTIQIYRSDKIAMPLTLGLFPTKIYVPAVWDQWTQDCKRMVIRHEMAHIRRHDGLFQVFQIIAQAIYFFHPLVLLLNRRLKEYREMACDDASIGSKKSSSVEYSRVLVEIAEKMLQNPVTCESASALIRQKRELLNRVQYQMEDRMRKIPKKKIIMILAGLILLGILLSWHCIKEHPTEPATLSEETEQSPLAKGDDVPVFIPFDDPPGPIGGYKAIQSKIVYPEMAKQAGVEGRLMVWAQIDEEGNVVKTKVRKSLGPNGCDEAAMNAIRAVKWTPAKNKGKLVKVWVAVPVDFRLSPIASLKAITNMIDGESSSRQLQQELQQELTTLSEQSGEEKPTFVPFDQPPEPIGGYAAIKSKIVYPEIAKQSGIEGRILIWAQIGEDGNVTRMKVHKSLGPNGCDEAAMNAIRAVKWIPAKKDGKPIKVWIIVPVDFRLN